MGRCRFLIDRVGHYVKVSTTYRRSKLAVALLTAASFLFGLWKLDGRSLWVDELSTFSVATAPNDRFLGDLTLNGANMSLYLVVMRAWLTVADSEWWLRLPSVIFATASVPVFFQLARRLVSPRAALVGAGLVGLSPAVAWHARDARSYTLAMLLILGSWLAAVRESEDPSPARRRIYIALAVLSIYAHLIAVIWIAAQLLWLSARSRRREIDVAVIIALLAAPQFVTALHPAAQEPSWIPALSGRQLIEAGQFLTGTSSTPAMSALLVVWVTGAVLAFRRAKGALAVVWLVLPTIVIILASLAMPLLVPRYLLLSVPAGALLVAIVVDALPPRVAAALVVGVLVVTLPEMRSRATQDRVDWEELAHIVFDNSAPGERILFWDTRRQLEYYWEQSGRPTVPDSVSPPESWGPPRRTYPRMAESGVREVIASGRGLWLVQRISETRPPPPDLRTLLGGQYEAQGWRIVGEWTSGPGADGTVGRIVHYART